MDTARDHASTIEAEICPSRQRFSRPANWEGTVIRVLDCRLTHYQNN